MSRSRNIKPGFFKNEGLSELPFEYRILFQGLWCEADRAGRLEDRPKRIKAEVFPYDAVDVEAGLAALAQAGFIERYEEDGAKCIQVVNFLKHQNPHKRESESLIPAKAGPRPVQAPEIPEQAEEIPEPARLIPDSGFLIPTEANASDAAASSETPPADPIWGTGLAFLRRKGIPEKSARGLLGKLRQACGDVETGSLLAQAESDDIADPAPWLMASASKRRSRAGPHSAPQAMGKTAQGLMALEDFANGGTTGLAETGNRAGAAAPHVPGFGADSGSGGGAAHGSRVARIDYQGPRVGSGGR